MKFPSTHAATVGALLLLCPSVATAQATPALRALPAVEWTPLAPLPGAAPRVWSLAMSDAEPETAYAGTSAGLLLSSDGGANWNLQGRWPRDYAGYGQIDVSPVDPDLIVGAFGLSGVWRSTDRGLTWAKPVTAPDENLVASIRFTPGCSSIAYAQGFGRYLWRSTDGGLNWHHFFDAGPSGTVTAFDTAHGDAFRTAVHAGANIWVTTDGGLNWDRRSAPAGGNGSLRFDPFDPTRMLLTGFGRIFITTDEAQTWTEYNVPSDSIFDAVDWDRATPDVIHAGLRGVGVLRSADGGATWSIISGGGLDRAGVSPKAIRSSAQRPGRVVVGDNAGLFTSTDGGLHYSDNNAGLGHLAFISGIAPDPFDDETLLVGTGGSVYRSADGGASWDRATLSPGTLPGPIQADPTTPGRYYIPQTSRGVHRSDDGGRTFQLVYAQPGIGFWNLKAHPTVPGRVFGAGSGLRRSDDGGATFSGNLVGAGWAWDVEISAVNPDIMYCSTGSVLYRSLDGGVTFEAAITSPPAVARSIHADLLDPQVAYATSDYTGVWKTTDAGLHWTHLPQSGSTATALAPLHGIPDGWAVSLWAQNQIQVTLDGGLHFRRIRTPHGTSAPHIHVLNGKLLVGTEGAGVMRLDGR